MFNTERAIAEWRKQMLAVGIKSPVPLDELELHLREDIAEQSQSGRSEQSAFEAAVLQIGQGDSLKREFAKTKDLLIEDRTIRLNRILAAIWMAQALWFLSQYVLVIRKALVNPLPFGLGNGFFFLILSIIMYLAGALGGVYLFRGVESGRRIIRFLALLGVIACVPQFIMFKSLSAFGGTILILDVVSIWLLRPPKHEEPKLAAE